ncbi:MAG TPA: class I SAM-dependent methyltransferase [Acidimicrobiales bacterium]|nr:class I SAM-dependent methyltransferase [Acidimicrobiales bacterium]
MAERRAYSLDNSSDDEAARLTHLQALGDPISIRWMERLGVGAGWRCLELGAGAGSIARWLSDTVGQQGSVTALDQDVSQLRDLEALRNVSVVEGDLCTMQLPPGPFDLAHSRAVLMHLECPDHVVTEVVDRLAPGGMVFFEETGGAPALGVQDPPEPYAVVMLPLARRWTWADSLTVLLESLGMVGVRDDVRQETLAGGTPRAAFWQHTLSVVAPLLGDEAGAAVPAMVALLDDPSFELPFSERHRVTATRPH